MGSKVCGTPEMMGGWPGALAAFSHLRLDSEEGESDGGLPHGGCACIRLVSMSLCEDTEEDHVPPAGDRREETGADCLQACLCLSKAE